MNTQLEYAFKDAINFTAKLNKQLKKINPGEIPQEYKEAIIKQLEMLVDKIVLGVKRMNKLAWYIKQLFPLTYRTQYKEDGKQHFVVWQMWFGRSYSIDDHIIG